MQSLYLNALPVKFNKKEDYNVRNICRFTCTYRKK